MVAVVPGMKKRVACRVPSLSVCTLPCAAWIDVVDNEKVMALE
jgi:hypothetical protein